MKNPISFFSATRSRRAATGAMLPTRMLLAFLLGLGLLAVPGRAQTYGWATKTSNMADKSVAVADKEGSSYVLSRFNGTITVNNKTFTSLGGADLLLSKYFADGKLAWIARIGGAGDEQVGDLTLSVQENVLYLTGAFHSTVHFGKIDGTTATKLTSAGQADLFIASYHEQGAFLWAQRAGGTGVEYPYGIDIDKNDNPYVTGSFTGTTQFSNGNLVTSLPSSGNSDIFLAKFNDSGVFQLARRLGSNGTDYGTSVAVDKYAGGDVYVTGAYAPATHPGTPNAFVAKFNASAVLQWAELAGAAATADRGNDVIIGWDGTYVTGYFSGSATFGSTTLASSGSTDAFVAFYPRPGAPSAAWAKRYGGPGWDEGRSLTYANWMGSEVSWYLYVAGSFTGTANIAGTTLNAAGGAADRDVFVGCIAWHNGLNWARRLGSVATDNGYTLHTVPDDVTLGGNSLLLTGHLNGTVTLGKTTLPGPGGMVTRIDLPHINTFQSINAVTDADYEVLGVPAEINLMTLGTQQINLRANITPGTVGSVQFVLDGVTKTDNTAPFTWAGDAPKWGGTDYFAFTPTLGQHKLQATPFSGPNGTGVRGKTQYVTFTVVNKPVIKNVTVVNAITEADVHLIGGQPISYSEMGTDRFNLRANPDPGTVGSVKFVLDGVTRIENGAWPYSWAGEQIKVGGFVDYNSITLAEGSHTLSVTAYTGANATGTASNTYYRSFYVYKVYSGGAGRVASAAPGPEAPAATLKVAPNPFTGRTSLSFTAREAGPATVEVYNAQGLRVGRLYQGPLEAGKDYRWELDGTALPNGMYFARLKAGHHVYTQRLVLNK